MNQELDRWLADNLMDWDSHPRVDLWYPSTNIEQALGDGGPGTVVGAMPEGWRLFLEELNGEDIEYYGGKWEAEFFIIRHKQFYNFVAYASTPAAAICEAAKKALGGEIGLL